MNTKTYLESMEADIRAMSDYIDELSKAVKRIANAEDHAWDCAHEDISFNEVQAERIKTLQADLEREKDYTRELEQISEGKCQSCEMLTECMNRCDDLSDELETANDRIAELETGNEALCEENRSLKEENERLKEEIEHALEAKDEVIRTLKAKLWDITNAEA